MVEHHTQAPHVCLHPVLPPEHLRRHVHRRPRPARAFDFMYMYVCMHACYRDGAACACYLKHEHACMLKGRLGICNSACEHACIHATGKALHVQITKRFFLGAVELFNYHRTSVKHGEPEVSSGQAFLTVCVLSWCAMALFQYAMTALVLL